MESVDTKEHSGVKMPSKYALFKHRRNMFMEILKDENPEISKGVVVLISDFENERHVFRQESSFYYLTGIKEPGVIMLCYFDGREELYIPAFAGNREQWVTTKLDANQQSANEFQVDTVKHLGLPVKGYSLSSVADQNTYFNLLNDLSNFLYSSDARVFAFKDNSPIYQTQMQIFNYLGSQVSNLKSFSDDCSYILHELRRFKDDYELDCLHKAVQVTTLAQDTAAKSIQPGKYEFEIQAMIESVFTVTQSKIAFPSIVASGKNTTVLHYNDRDQELKDGDLVVIDIGAEFNYYAADITRTYPVSGKFTDRQREVYKVVLETQRYIESMAAPGMYLNNPSEPDKSLQHLAVNYLKKAGYDKYFVHGIGHYLGLDVHDVGDTALPLEEGNVITIEPGIYIAEENLGVRIEDDYVIVEGGCLQLSEQLPKDPDEIEAMMVIK